MIMRERLLAEYVPWVDYIDRDMVWLTGSRVLMLLGLDGLPFETIEESIITRNHVQLEAALRNGAQDGLNYHFLQCRGMADPAIYPHGDFRTAFAERFDRRYEERLFGTRSMYLNKTYLGVELAPRHFGGDFLHRHLRRQDVEPSPLRMERLRRVVDVLGEHLHACNPRVLGIVRRNGIAFSEIAEATAFATTGYWRPVPLTASGASAIFSEKVVFGREAFEIRLPHGSTYGAALNMADYPFETGPGMFDAFLSSSYRHTIYHGFRCLPAVEGVRLLTRKQNRMKAAGDKALSQVVELTDAIDLVASNRMLMGDHAFAMTLFADDHDALPEVIRRGWTDLGVHGIKVEREDLAIEAVWASMIFGNFHLRGREAGISSRNFAAFAAMHTFPAGEEKGFWGDPIAIVRTSGGTARRLHLHHKGVGNFFISGLTGSGKTTLLGFLICQAERSGSTVILWDKDRGLESLVRALSPSSYLSLAHKPQVAPLKRLTDSTEDLAFLAGLIRAQIATPEPYELTSEEHRRLAIGLRYVMALPPEDRWMEEVRAFMGTSRNGAGARLEKWCWGNEFGWVTDGPADLVDLNGRLIAFDQTDILDDPIASGAILATLFHYTGQLVDGRRLLFLLDEVWNGLRIPQFHAQIHNGLKTWRKYNSPIGTATQSVRDALDSPIGHTIREQCPTQICFANPGATWADYGPEGLNYSPKEFDIIKALPEGTGKFLFRQGRHSEVLQAPLFGMAEVDVISGTRSGIDALERARKRVGDDDGLALSEAYLEELAQ